MPRPSAIPFLLSIAALFAACGTSAKDVPEDAPAEVVFAAARASQEAGELKVARDLYERVYEDYPAAKENAEAGWLEAEMMFQLEEYKSAKTAFQNFYETHPLYRLGELENRLYKIGEELFIDGQSGLLGLGLFPTSSAGISTMEWIAEKLRNGARADDALMFMARANMDLREYADATINLEELLSEYKQSEWIFEARYLLGESLLSMNRGVPYDGLVLLQSKEVFKRYIEILDMDEVRRVEYADRLVSARERIVEIDRRLAERNLLIANFYISVERIDSAKMYLNAATRMYPGTEAAESARQKLEELGSQPK